MNHEAKSKWMHPVADSVALHRLKLDEVISNVSAEGRLMPQQMNAHTLLALQYTWRQGLTPFLSFLSAEMCCPSRCSYQMPSPKPRHTGSWRPSRTWDKVRVVETSSCYNTKRIAFAQPTCNQKSVAAHVPEGFPHFVTVA